MKLKQLLKILSIATAIISTIGLFLPAIKQNGNNYNYFELAFENTGFKFGLFLIIAFTAFALTTAFISISYDKNKIFPLIILVLSLTAGILSIFTLKLSYKGNSSAQIIQWIGSDGKKAKIIFGVYLVSIGMFLTSLFNIIISVRSLIFKIDDDLEDYENEEEIDEEIESEEETELKELIDDFKNKQ